MKVTQLSLFMENKAGHLQNILKILADARINIATLTIAEINDFGILRIIVDNPEKAVQILKGAGVAVSVTEVLAVEIADEPGSLYKTVDVFSREKLNIEYMYAFTQKINGKAVMIFRFDDIGAARRAAENGGLKIVRNADIIGA